MTFKSFASISAIAGGLMLLAGCSTTSSECDACNSAAGESMSVSMTPCMDALKKFTASDVPALGPGETEVAPGHWTTNASPVPANLPGKGMAQHPMLYIGEGY